MYTFDAGVYRLFEVNEIDEDIYICQEFNLEPKSFRRHQTLNFGLVGVFICNGYLSEKVNVTSDLVKGKVISIGALLFTVPKNILIEL